MTLLPFVLIGVAAAWGGFMLCCRDRAVTSKYRAFLGFMERTHLSADLAYDAMVAAHREVVWARLTERIERLEKAMRQMGISAAEAQAAFERIHNARIAAMRKAVHGPTGRLP